MRLILGLWLAAALACAGCAARNDDAFVAMSMMQAADAAQAASRRPPVAVVEKTLISPRKKQSFNDHTLLRVRGERADFRVLTGPLGPAWKSALQAAEQIKAAPAPVDDPAPAAAGEFRNPDGEWYIEEGYAYMWGWWPTAITPRVAAGADGSAFLVIIDTKNFREVIVFLEGEKLTISSSTGNLLREVQTVEHFVEVTGTPQAPAVSNPAPVSQDASDPVRTVLNEVKERRKLLERW